MKKLILTCFLLVVISVSCSVVDDDYMSTGTITGIDTRECVCCGGYFIDINKTTYRFFEVPSNSGLDLSNPDFPIAVKLDWHDDPEACLGDEIIVTRIEKK